ncbi:MAG: cytochrome d ubiquinol oxidase subunit II [Pseudomonadota bacterium]
MTPDVWLPLAFFALMGLAMLIYAVLDGYDLGVGMLLLRTDSDAERDTMIASIGPFWDANETWLVLGVGLMLVAFPEAHGVVLGALYLPVALMLAGLILRGVAFDFRAKAGLWQKGWWDTAFFAGSWITSLSQGYMLGRYVTGFDSGAAAQAFALLSAVCVSASYCLIGSAWLIAKTDTGLRARAWRWGRTALWLSIGGLALVSVVNPLVSPRIAERWFNWPDTLWLAPIPLLTAGLLIRLRAVFQRADNTRPYTPLLLTAPVFVLAFAGLAYSFFPEIVPGQLTVWEAASSTATLQIIFYGALAVLPFIGGYTVLSYWIFRGKATHLRYD